jgi:two-component sensor histidine kinase
VENLESLSASENKTINFEATVVNVRLSIDESLPIGLILSELVTNSLKYAFADSATGLITISIVEKDGQMALEYSDNGVGLPDEFILEEQESLGFTVISALTEQIEGELTIVSFSPFRLKITF